MTNLNSFVFFPILRFEAFLSLQIFVVFDSMGIICFGQQKNVSVDSTWRIHTKNLMFSNICTVVVSVEVSAYQILYQNMYSM